MFAGVSGAHINPAVTFSQVLGKRCSAVKGGLFVVSQCVGAIVGAAFAKVVGGDRYEALGSGAANEVFAPHSIGGAFLGEVLMTSVLCTTVLAATNATITKQFSHNGALLPFTVGMAVFLGHQVLIPVTNCSINPARSFGASVVANYWADHWLFWVAPLLGGAISTGLWETVLCPEEVEDKVGEGIGFAAPLTYYFNQFLLGKNKTSCADCVSFRPQLRAWMRKPSARSFKVAASLPQF
ncbi:unnamed protein product [Chrysoparadoxa australica]